MHPIWPLHTFKKMAILANDLPHNVRNDMDLIDELRAFVATAQTGSFTAAADHMGVSNRLTSKYVAALETRLGVRLLQRTTRRVGLTPAGADLLARAPTLLDELDELIGEVAEGSRGFTGMIRLSAPVTFGEIWVAPMLARFGAVHPGLAFDLRLTDRFIDLATDGIDLAFRIGRSDMQSLKQRKLGELRSLAVASPAYLAERGTPQTPADLVQHACILDTNRRNPRRWSFVQAGQSETIEVSGRYQVNSARAAAELAAAGHGVAYVPRLALTEALASGRLVPILSDCGGESGVLSAVWLEGRALPRKLRALIDFAQDDLRQADLL
ncbi:LysR family transcriptional regulator [Rhodobacter aestuarii]|uniref:Transcriptional regulator, LysR family n=2 Tax=Rhodobacter aestuarii TaxID=453582 RepID=A0A1N7LZG8_9RHOB|nr:LysR family transcriptional regulator [Rhodobacter aestuarii]SIS79240.1 transcriptional regulator, LysR family [Rhodobacter aestuarii]